MTDGAEHVHDDVTLESPVKAVGVMGEEPSYDFVCAS